MFPGDSWRETCRSKPKEESRISMDNMQQLADAISNCCSQQLEGRETPLQKSELHRGGCSGPPGMADHVGKRTAWSPLTLVSPGDLAGARYPLGSLKGSHIAFVPFLHQRAQLPWGTPFPRERREKAAGSLHLW